MSIRLILSMCGSCLLLVGLSPDVPAKESYWNQFRGPQGDGRSDHAELPGEFGDTRNVLWKIPIHGKGWSSPVVWGDQIWLTTAPEDGKELFAICVNLASGQIEHDLLVFEVAEPEFCHPTNSYASCTPYIEERRIYVHFGTYGTACLDTLTGEQVWERRDLHCDHYRGPGSSPIVYGDALFLTFDGVDEQFVVALDKRTGKTLWQRDRNIDYGTDVGDYKKAYCTPAVVRVDDQWQLISPSAVETIAYAPLTGRELWRIRHEGMNAAARPLFEHGLVYLCTGDAPTQLVAVRPAESGERVTPAIEWQTGRGVPKRSSLLVVDDRIFMVSDDGIAACLDATNGNRLWSKRLRGQYWASPIYAGGLIYFFSKEGRVVVIEAEDDFVLRAENEFSAGFCASPAVAGDNLILRSLTHLYRIAR